MSERERTPEIPPRDPDAESAERASDAAFVALLRGQLEDRAEAERDAALAETFRALPRVPAPRRLWPYLATALAAGVLAAVATWLLARDPRVEHRQHPSVAFDGGAGPSGGGGQVVTWDGAGRLATSELDGERLVFRSGRLVRVEHGPVGALDGTAIDLDGAGRVVRIETWVGGKLTATREVP